MTGNPWKGSRPRQEQGEAQRGHDPGQSSVLYSLDRWRAHFRRCGLRYRLLVVGGSAAEVVRHTGGWLFDLRATGWDVVVSIPDPSGMRGLEILGAVVLEPGSEPTTIIREVNPHVVASNASEHLTGVPGGRAIDHPHADGSVTVHWGPYHPSDAAGHLQPAQHRVSLAGAAFKERAMLAIDPDAGPAATTETFRTVMRPRHEELHRILGLTSLATSLTSGK
ncbi:hypothetical protein [Nocardia abscessus]|uniref:hypothetical protein n=1 Tax=Nocardia abscessus TaxID=120957 RepID=UPI0024570A69|nr:hypothetical protein [Nocardia abscessus]